MAEPRRVPLLTVKPANKIADPLEFKRKSQDKEKDKERGPTFRFTLKLADSNDNSFPEFSFKALVKKTEISHKEGVEEPKADALSDNEEEKLKELAKRLEERYGPGKNHKGKKRKHSLENLQQAVTTILDHQVDHRSILTTAAANNLRLELVDIGFGYDETDPFVDNSEAYDELVPSNWTTQYGGFYVNQGDLHYRRMSESDSDGDTRYTKFMKKKKPTTKQSKPKDGLVTLSKTPKELSTQKRKKQLLSKERKQKKLEKKLEAGRIKKSKKPKALKHAVLSTLQESLKCRELPSTKAWVPNQAKDDAPAETKREGITMAVISRSPADTCHTQNEEKPPCDTSDCNVTSSSNKVVCKTADLTKKSDENNGDFTANVPSFADRSLQQALISGASSEAPGEIKPENVTHPPKLPTDLPSEVLERIHYLKSESSCTTDGKSRFFNSSVNKSLLFIAKTCQQLQCKLRSIVYEYLAFYLPCTKETLIKRAKTLMIQDQINQLDDPLQALIKAIEESMPLQNQNYDNEIAKAVTEQVREQMKQSGLAPVTAGGVEEGAKDIAATGKADHGLATPSEEKTKRALPKRKFLWTDKLRSLLCEVVKIKVRLYKMSKSRSMTAEEYIKDFLEADVRKLWPKGWMTSRILYKESKGAHQEITQPLQKAKKVTKKLDPILQSDEDKVYCSAEDSKQQISSAPVQDLAALPESTETLTQNSAVSPRLSITVTAASKIKSALSSLLSPTVVNTLPTSSVSVPVASAQPNDPLSFGAIVHTNSISSVRDSTPHVRNPLTSFNPQSTKLSSSSQSECPTTMEGIMKFEKNELVYQAAYAFHSRPQMKTSEIPRPRTDHIVLSHGITNMLSSQESKSRERAQIPNSQTLNSQSVKDRLVSASPASSSSSLIESVTSISSSGIPSASATKSALIVNQPGHSCSSVNSAKNGASVKSEFAVRSAATFPPTGTADGTKESVIRRKPLEDDHKRLNKVRNARKVSVEHLTPPGFHKVGQGHSPNSGDFGQHSKSIATQPKGDTSSSHSKDNEQYFPAADLANLEVSFSDFADLDTSRDIVVPNSTCNSTECHMRPGKERSISEQCASDTAINGSQLGASAQKSLINVANKASTIVKYSDGPKSPAKSAISPHELDVGASHRFMYPAPKMTVSADHAGRTNKDTIRTKAFDGGSSFDFASGLSLLSSVSSIKASQVTSGKVNPSKVQTSPKAARQSPKGSPGMGTSPGVSRSSPLVAYLGSMEAPRGLYSHHLTSDVLVEEPLPSLVSESSVKAPIFAPGANLSSLPSSITLSSPQMYNTSLVPPISSMQGSSQRLLMQPPSQLSSALSTSLVNYSIQQQQHQQQLHLQAQGKGLSNTNPFTGLQGPFVLGMQSNLSSPQMNFSPMMLFQGAPNSGNAEFQGQYSSFRPAFN